MIPLSLLKQKYFTKSIKSLFYLSNRIFFSEELRNKEEGAGKKKLLLLFLCRVGKLRVIFFSPIPGPNDVSRGQIKKSKWDKNFRTIILFFCA